jgi:enoyl-CoA hydratase
MPAVYCEIINHAVGPRAASELTLFGQVYDLAAAVKTGVVNKTSAPGRLLHDAVAWAALVPPDCFPIAAIPEIERYTAPLAATNLIALKGEAEWHITPLGEVVLERPKHRLH